VAASYVAILADAEARAILLPARGKMAIALRDFKRSGALSRSAGAFPSAPRRFGL
jgi:hypothetical protein